MPRASEPTALPFVARTLMPREVRTNAAMAVALGALEGGLVGIVVKTQFAEVASAAWVNLAVALVAGAPAFANVVSLWVSGRATTRPASPPAPSRCGLLTRRTTCFT